MIDRRVAGYFDVFFDLNRKRGLFCMNEWNTCDLCKMSCLVSSVEGIR